MRRLAVVLSVVIACSPRVQLSERESALDGGSGSFDSGPSSDAGGLGSDAGSGSGMDAGIDAGIDAGGGSSDAGTDAGTDAGIDAATDAASDGSVSPPPDGAGFGGNRLDSTSFYACNGASGTPAMWLPLAAASLLVRRRRRGAQFFAPKNRRVP